MAGNFVRTKGGLLIPRPQEVTAESLTRKQLELAEVARDASREGHNTVDDIRVGSAIRTVDDRIFSGSNLRGSGITRHLHAEEAAMMAAEMAGYTGGIVSAATVSDYDPIKLMCDACSRMFLIRAAASGIDTEIILSDIRMKSFMVLSITEMFRNRNLPCGEIEIESTSGSGGEQRRGH